jgi:phage terminase Nu1 subunit (DNA packaging protein)
VAGTIPTVVKGKAEVAAHFGVTRRTITNWEHDGMPGRSGRNYDLVAIQIWLDRKQGRSPARDDRQGFLTEQRGKDFQDERYKKASADLKEMEVRKRRKELVEWGAVEAAFTSRITAVKQALLTFERSLPPQLVHCGNEREMEAVIHQAVRATLESFARPLAVAGGEMRGGDDNGSSQGDVAEGGR